MAVIYFVYSLISGWTFGLFPLWALMNNATMNVHAQVFVWTKCFISLGYIYLGLELLDHMVYLV